MKSGLACALTAFSGILKKVGRGMRPVRPLVFIGTVDEEDFMRGVEAAIRWGWATKQDWYLDTEPTDGQIQVAHKGRLWFELTMEGITAHASNPWKGADAIAAMAEAVSLIRRRIKDCPAHHDLGISTVTFGQIEGGYRPYVVPDRCRVWIDMRLVPPTDTAAAKRIMDCLLYTSQKEVRFRRNGGRTSLKLMISICPGQLARNPFPTISLELEISMKAWGSTWRI